MNTNEVPQDNNCTLGGYRKAMYARDESGRMVIIPSSGWEVEEIVTTQAIETVNAQAEAARQHVLAGQSSPLEYWMYAQRMDLEMLAQVTGLWRWRIRRHLRPAVFAKLSPALLARYAQALGLSPSQISHLPEQA